MALHLFVLQIHQPLRVTPTRLVIAYNKKGKAKAMVVKLQTDKSVPHSKIEPPPPIKPNDTPINNDAIYYPLFP